LRHFRKTLTILSALVLVALSIVGAGFRSAASASTSPWTVSWSTAFQQNASKGQFTGCDSTTFVCSGLPANVKWQWGAYPAGWPDTATQRGITPGGLYEPQDTVWISNGVMTINEYNSGGTNHVAALVPLKAMNSTYGKYIETLRVTNAPTGFKSAHLLWPNAADSNPNSGAEIDFPEGDWNNADGHSFAYYHPGDGGSDQLFGDSGVLWSAWHTYCIKWIPGEIDTYVDNRLILKSTDPRFVPSQAMDWIIQNESALDGQASIPGQHAQMQISYAEYDRYTPRNKR
jgi:hypothetical protein